MSLELRNYNGTLFTTVDDNTVNTSASSISLVGKGIKEWGIPTQQSVLWILQNFAGSSSPTHPVVGQLWYDSSENKKLLKLWNGSTWIGASGTLVTESMPIANNLGQANWNKLNNQPEWTKN